MRAVLIAIRVYKNRLPNPSEEIPNRPPEMAQPWELTVVETNPQWNGPTSDLNQFFYSHLLQCPVQYNSTEKSVVSVL